MADVTLRQAMAHHARYQYHVLAVVLAMSEPARLGDTACHWMVEDGWRRLQILDKRAAREFGCLWA